MKLLHHPGKLVGSQTSSSTAAPRARGFTLLEIQIAIVILALAMIGMIGHGRVYERVLNSLQSEHRFDGVAMPAGDRVVVSVAQVGNETSPPRCEVRLEMMDEMPGNLSAEIRVTRRTP
jgi:prepilin-type N-terminal cleavage/methylation domain-containing protein